MTIIYHHCNSKSVYLTEMLVMELVGVEVIHIKVFHQLLQSTMNLIA